MKRMLTLTVSSALALSSCAKKEEKKEVPPVVVNPGALMNTFDLAMSTVQFEGQAASLASDWIDTHCEEQGNATKAAFDDDSSIVWGCLIAVKTDGPDTPRGGVNRLVQLGCEFDRNIAAGTLKVDGNAHTFTGIIDDECWGEEFAAMVADEMPDLVEEDGFVHAELEGTGYTSIPADWSDVPSDWDNAFQMVFKLGEGETKVYKVLVRERDDGMAASILTEGDARPEVFAMSITSTGGADDEHEFRYEGRFGYGQFGDDSFGSRHVRVLVKGPYAGSGGFSSITSGLGYEAGMWGSDATTLAAGKVKTFAADDTGLGAKDFNVTAEGSFSGSPVTSGVSGINEFTFTASAAERASFLTTDIAAYTDADTWFVSNGPLDYTDVAISD